MSPCSAPRGQYHPSIPVFCAKTLHAAAAAKSLQSCPTLCDTMESSPPGSPVHRILQARILEWVAIYSMEITGNRGQFLPSPVRQVECSGIGKGHMGNRDGEIREPGYIIQSTSLGSCFNVIFTGPNKKTDDSTERVQGRRRRSCD